MNVAFERDLGALLVGTGPDGADAIEGVVGALPRRLPCPVLLVVQGVSEATAERLAALRRVRLVVDKQPLTAGFCHLAPPDYHLLVDEGALALSVDAREHGMRPALAPLFQSAAWAFRGAVRALLLGATGPDADAAAAAVPSRWLLRGGVGDAEPLLRTSLFIPEVARER